MVLRAVLLALVLALSGTAAVTTGVAPAEAAPAGATRPARAEPGDPVKWYLVQPEFGGEQEYLYEIAERFLGDGERYDEIFALNKGRLQPDGGRLTVPDEIEAGWVLQLPADAQGPEVRVGSLPSATPSGPAASTPPTTAEPRRSAGSSPESTLLPILLVVGLLLATAVLVALLIRRRQRPAAAPPATVAPRPRGVATPYDGTASWTIDRALRVLVTSAAAARRPVPPVCGISVEDSTIGLRLSIADPEPLAPWESREHGLLWVAAWPALQALPADPRAIAPCPRLVTLGTRDGARELLDLGAAPGPVGLRGDAAATRALLAGWAAELTGSPWSAGVRVVAGGLLPEVADGGAVFSVPGLDDAVTQAAEPQAPGDGWLSVLLLGAAPAGRDADRVAELAARPGAPWAVVVLGSTGPPGRQLVLHPDGRLDTGTPAGTVQAVLPVIEPRPA